MATRERRDMMIELIKSELYHGFALGMPETYATTVIKFTLNPNSLEFKRWIYHILGIKVRWEIAPLFSWRLTGIIHFPLCLSLSGSIAKGRGLVPDGSGWWSEVGFVLWHSTVPARHKDTKTSR